MDETELNFLEGLFPHISEADLTNYFGALFESKPWGPDKSKAERASEIAGLDKAIERLENLSLDDREEAFKIRAACRDIGSSTQNYPEIDADKPNFDRVVKQMKEYRTLSAKWNELNPRTKGLNIHAENLTNAVATIFEEMGEKVTSGTKKGRPSTKFGKVVERAFDYHEIGQNWISPVRRIADKRKSLEES